MKKTRFSGKQVKELNKRIEELGLADFLDKNDKVEVWKDEIIAVNEQPAFFYHKDKIVPTLQLNMKHNILPRVVVDMPAVPFMARGADVMRPGIVEMDDFEENQYVVVVDENHGKNLAVGRAKYSSDEIRAMDTGRVVENLHHVGDDIWNLGNA